ncbi:unnamed protein product [Darwinula stevensoni]|uniref:Fibronectin type-III domain-containing protein n=1 Tax=Darwinula stevensoni TaxID=69355 RepID=A0A7R8X9C4_9CRUS|nr:unnamed protein product [Darwinula stevensoni]CAG0890509.1 unnamed protein product [Darwinula stevensoni]
MGTSELACLGRPFLLGSLYDRREDRLVDGMTLWNEETLSKHLRKVPRTSCNFEIIAEDTISKKTSALNIDASLKLSVFSGIVEVSGSGKYLEDRKSSSQQSRITLQYKSTTRYESLTMEQLATEGIQHPNVFKMDIATHVVTGIEYGADAFFVFDRQVSSNKTAQEVRGELNVVIEKLNYFSQRKSLGHSENPTTFQEGLQVFEELSALSREMSVAKRVSLFPLHKLNNKPARSFREISVGIIQEVEDILEAWHDVKVRANDLANSKVSDHFSGIGSQLKIFRSQVDGFKATFQRRIIPTLKAIRGSGENEASLSQIVEEVLQSPFSKRNLSTWVTGKEMEIRTLETLLQFFERVHFALNPVEFCSVISDPGIPYVICFVFGMGHKTDAFLERLSRCLKGKEMDNSSYESEIPTFWFEDQRIMQGLLADMRNFMSFFKANESKPNLRFVVTEKDLKNTSHDILLYEGGVSRRFVPSGIPGAPKALEFTHEKIRLSWKPPRCGLESVEGYRVSYRQLEGKEEWHELMLNEKSEIATITVLTPKKKIVCKRDVTVDYQYVG